MASLIAREPFRSAGMPTPSRARRQTPAASFNYLVCTGEQRLRHGEINVICGFQIDHKLEARRLRDRQVRRLGALIERLQRWPPYPLYRTISQTTIFESGSNSGEGSNNFVISRFFLPALFKNGSVALYGSSSKYI